MENKTNKQNLETLIFLTEKLNINIFSRITIDKSLCTVFLYAVDDFELYKMLWEFFGDPKISREENVTHYIFKYDSAKIVLTIDNRI